MRTIPFATLPSLMTILLLAAPALATVNHGDFIGTDVDFEQVSETTLTADPEPLWDTPSLSGTGDQLLFFPPNFVSSCAAGASDTTASTLTTTIASKGQAVIDTVFLQEGGDATLTAFPPFGTPATNASAALSGTVTVTEDDQGPIAPVVIPFNGTFTPSSSFALPGNFGLSNWTGNILVDVGSVVPNATVAELSLTNTLDSNCAPGNTAASIQKKTVAGPGVAIIINPIECDLELDKTCCVTQPALPELGQCEGDVVSLEFEYTGDSCKASNNDQGRAFRCHGRRRIGEPANISILRHDDILDATPSSGVNKGETVEFTSSTGVFPDKLKIKTTGPWWRKQYMKIDTSCDRALQCGDQFGAYEVTGFESTLGGVVDCGAPPPPPVCAHPGDPAGTPCDAKIVDMVLEYNGQPCQNPLPNPQNGEAECNGDSTGQVDVGIVYTGQHPHRETIAPSSGINDGDLIRVTSTHKSGMHPNQKYLITNSGGTVQSVEFHTSCSQPFNLGDEFGPFKVVEFTTKSGTTVALGDGTDGTADACEVPLAPPGPHCTGDLEDITLVYIGDFLGEGCTVSNTQGGWAKCIGDADPGDPVSITPGSGLEADPEDQIEFGDLVTLSKSDGSDLPGFTTFDVTGAGGSQWIQIKTSCYRPLSLGDRFGSFVVFGMTREDSGPITLGGNVQYQYKVSNPNASTVQNVSIDDDQLGNIVSGLSLAPGEEQSFSVDATLFGTTTNVATATGDVDGNFCAPGVDQVTVGVLAPPQGSFHCNGPVSELTMIWNGSQTVDIRAWSGAVGSSTELGYFQDVAPGDAVEVTGLGEFSETRWEIFASAGFPKLGESKFDLYCNDKKMNGIEDCGSNQGNWKWNDPGLINDFLLEGMVDDDETLACTPGLVPAPPDCGFGPELLLVLPGLMLMHRRRLQRE